MEICCLFLLETGIRRGRMSFRDFCEKRDLKIYRKKLVVLGNMGYDFLMDRSFVFKKKSRRLLV